MNKVFVVEQNCVYQDLDEKDKHAAYDHVTFTRPGYLQNTKIYNIPKEDGSVDYLEIPIKKDNSLDRDNVKYISKGNVKTLTKEERIINLKGAFKISSINEIKNKNIILIDDVMTTGATISECKYILKKSGVKQIIVLTIAKSNI